MPVIFYVLLGMIVFSVIALLLTPNLFRPSPEAQRIMDISKSDRPDQRTIHAKELMQNQAAPHPSMMAGLGRTDCNMSSKHVNRIDKSCVRC